MIVLGAFAAVWVGAGRGPAQVDALVALAAVAMGAQSAPSAAWPCPA